MQTLLGFPLPKRWQFVSQFGPAGACYRDIKTGMSIIETMGTHDGKEWHHLSASYPDHVPTYEELTLLKAVFIGEANRAIMVFPSKSHHVNIHHFALHLYTCTDDAGDGLPHFDEQGSI